MNSALFAHIMKELRKRVVYQSPLLILVILIVSIYFVETAIMFLFQFITVSSWVEVFVDGFSLIVIIMPVLYFFILRPLNFHIAELKKSEKALKETSNYLESLINYANAPIIVWNPAFKIMRFNHVFEHLTGYTADEVIGKELGMLFPDVSRDESMENIVRTSDGEFWESVEIPIIRKDGDIRIALWNSANIYADDRMTLMSTIAQGQDITERKKSEKALKETSNYLESLINYANAPIIVWNPAFKITLFNHAFEHLTGYTADEVIGKELGILFPDVSREESKENIVRTSGGEFWESVEIPIIRKDGDIRIALWNSANIYADDRMTLMSTIAQGQDITERKQAEKEIMERIDELERFSKATVQREFRIKELRDENEDLKRRLGIYKV